MFVADATLSLKLCATEIPGGKYNQELGVRKKREPVWEMEL